jgi:NADPH:quinone reductase-like Zn-dependent oxidoreductase
MKAAQFNYYGGPDVIGVDQNAPIPSLRAGQILIECHAVSINPIDSILRSGSLMIRGPHELDRIGPLGIRTPDPWMTLRRFGA